MNVRSARLLVLSALLLVAFTALSVFNYRTMADAIHDEIVSSSLPLLQENLYTEILTDLSPALNISSMMASDSFLIRWAEAGEREPERMIEYLETIHRQYGYFSVFFVSNRTWNYYHHTGITKRISPDDAHDDWYFDFVASDIASRLDVDTNEAADDRLTIFVNYRLTDFTGELLGVTGVGLEMDGFAAFLRSRQQKYNRTIYLVDRDGLVQAHPDLTRIHATRIGDDPDLAPVAAALLTPSDAPVDATYTRDRNRYLVSSRYIPELDWFLFVEQNETASLRSARSNLWRTILVGLAVSVAIISLSAMTMRRFDAHMEVLATTDELTGAANRRAFNTRFSEARSRADREGSPLSLIIFDVDEFKGVNDRFGHQAGDRVLRRISDTVRGALRPNDFLTRWGGDEFAILVEGTADAARTLAERIRVRLADAGAADVPVTISIGIAEYAAGEAADPLVRRADQALYQAKLAGRNRISTASY